MTTRTLSMVLCIVVVGCGGSPTGPTFAIYEVDDPSPDDGRTAPATHGGDEARSEERREGKNCTS